MLYLAGLIGLSFVIVLFMLGKAVSKSDYDRRIEDEEQLLAVTKIYKQIKGETNK